MDEIAPADRRKKWFLWGMMLTGISSIPVAIAIVQVVHSLRQISEPQATGLGAVAGGFAEVYAIFGLILAFLLPFGAIVFLAKSFAEQKRTRAVLSIICICWSAIMLAIPVWVAWFLIGRRAIQ
jgi:F0F1-type ATP synthase membrane subunit c/vacuolar-type H+-ATPase subunit K